MYLSPIITILIGLFVWLLIPKWLKYGKKKTRQKIQFWCNIIGILLVLIGGISLVRMLGFLVAG
ncbi:MAG: hypothetical protein IKJ81_03570 [Bacteroidales bacterium]|nr:hypothetical protein [Bacteroidales bacterium]